MSFFCNPVDYVVILHLASFYVKAFCELFFKKNKIFSKTAHFCLFVSKNYIKNVDF